MGKSRINLIGAARYFPLWAWFKRGIRAPGAALDAAAGFL
jgi:hypothetical protein